MREGSAFPQTIRRNALVRMWAQVDRKAASGVEDIRKLLKSVCKPVVMPPEFKKQLLERLMHEAKKKGW